MTKILLCFCLMPATLSAQLDGAMLDVGIKTTTVNGIEGAFERVLPEDAVGFNNQFWGVEGNAGVWKGNNCFQLSGNATGQKLRKSGSKSFQPYMAQLSLNYGLRVTRTNSPLVYPSIGGGAVFSTVSTYVKQSGEISNFKNHSRFSPMGQFMLSIAWPLQNYDQSGNSFTGPFIGLRTALQLYPNYGAWGKSSRESLAAGSNPRNNLIGVSITLIFGAASFLN